ncbi:MAG: WG repeat-containing protein [Zoogloeaceae bacterium]|jgi:predicted small lipoprotein YifL|nr:WG repeat-containing protein [Zoogloeaceae bacterium]
MQKAMIMTLLASLLFTLAACNGTRGPKYRAVRPYSEGLAPVQSQNGKWGYIDKQQRWVIQPRFDDAKEFQDGRAPACQNKKCGFINRRGEWL